MFDMFRLYVDEVGHDGLKHLDHDNDRYLSLTGIAVKIAHARDTLDPSIDRLKAEIFDQDIDAPVVLHRKDIVRYKGPFQILRDAAVRAAFDEAICSICQSAEYTVITTLIDKQWMLQQHHWRKSHPYHYLMEILVEKYVQFLMRQQDIGDIMPESRDIKDKKLQNAFETVRLEGTDYVTPAQIASVLRGPKLKFRSKAHNIAGLQLCDLIAHPSHMYARSLCRHPVQLGPFAQRVVNMLTADKYDRSPWNGRISGYGIKCLPNR